MFVHILFAIAGAILALVISNNISAKEKAKIQAALDAANAKLAQATKK